MCAIHLKFLPCGDKLWKEGDLQIQVGDMRNGKVYVYYRDRVYVRYSTITNFDGSTSRYISSWSSHSDVPAPTQAETFAGHIPEELEVIDLDLEDPGIDPIGVNIRALSTVGVVSNHDILSKNLSNRG